MTDNTIDVTCPECGVVSQGLGATMSHILDFHIEYTPSEAANFATAWMEDAYEKEQHWQAGYNQERKLDKAIHSDSFPHK